MRGHEKFLRRVLVNSDEIEGEEIVDSTDFVLSRELPLAPGLPYVLVPSSFLPNKDGEFKIIIYTHKKREGPGQASRGRGTLR
ncbi:hypothetical protein T492DRAFT_886994 [Pavlovales sp. CCMP2436]|nr:hypothetical protein T492DRAFT_886994 [Pavlovales sp. CCMP2436]